MPARKAPSPEEAKKLFLSYPNKKLSYWADEWGITIERVRQIKLESGVGSKFDINYDVAKQIANKIASGEYTLTQMELYDDFPIGREAFMTWIRKSEDVENLILKAQEIAKKNKLNPNDKQCKKCKSVKSVDNFTKSQRYIDGRLPWCESCVSERLDREHDEEKEKSTKKICLLCKKQKSLKSFTANKNYRDGLVPFCKTCKSKSRRAKRAISTKITDTIN